ncbi:MAG: biotin/lipoyl-containing protein [Planctomycetota bacterium]
MSLRKTFVRDGEAVAVVAERVGGDHWRVRIGDRVLEFRVATLGNGGVRLVPVGAEAEPACTAFGVQAQKAWMVRVGGRTFTLREPEGGRRGGGAGGGDGVVRAPMTGTVLQVLCAPGDQVTADQTLAVLSAMKMEHKLTAGVAGTVKKVGAAEGDTVDQGAALIEVEPAAEAKP